MTDSSKDVVVRLAIEADVVHAEAVATLIRSLAEEHSLAVRSPELLADKIRHGRAALAMDGEEVVGFGYWSHWEGGKFVSHSGLVVRRDHWNRGIGKRLKLALFASSRQQLPEATLMSLTNSPQVKELNLALGFSVVPLDLLTSDPEFWKGCATCHNFADAQARGERCCCEGLILDPGPTD